MDTLRQVQKELQELSDPVKAKGLAWFFKTGPGQYGEGDVFLGITVPLQRAVAQEHASMPLPDIAAMLTSAIHEYRFTALEILVMKFERAQKAEQKRIFQFYCKHSKKINNWDLVDASAPYIAGEYLHDKPKNILYTFAKSRNVWQRRIAIVSTSAFIRRNHFAETVAIATLLLNDKHDLIHKAVGWMLREVGKRNEAALVAFLKKFYGRMPRTTLRYAIEKFSPGVRKQFLTGTYGTAA